MRRIVLFAGSLLLASAPTYRESIEEWRKTREATLKSDTGWLTVAGLYWLNEGANKAGKADTDPVQLPETFPYANFGVFECKGNTITFRPTASNLKTTWNGKPVTGPVQMKYDSTNPDLLVTGDFTMFVIKRNDRYAIRMRDKNSKMRREFTGLHWYPVKEEYRIEAKWVPYNPVKKIPVPTILNQPEEMESPGRAEFVWKGKKYSVEPVLEDGAYFYIFKDLTAGKETYPAGRFFYSDKPENGKVILDFNKAYTPPCAFTPYATCPLPPKQNRFPFRVEAGELNYGKH